MKLTVTSTTSKTDAIDLVAMIVFEEELAAAQAAPPLASRDPEIAGLIRSSLTDQRFKAKMGQTLLVDTQGRIAPRRIALVGAGARATFRTADYRHAAATLSRVASGAGARSLLLLDDAADASVAKAGAAAEGDEAVTNLAAKRIEALGQGFVLGGYRFEKYLSVDKRAPSPLETVTIQIKVALNGAVATAALARGERTAQAVSYARDLVNEPAGTLTPTVLANDISGQGGKLGLEVTVLGREECRARGMGMFLAVAQGSQEEPKFIHLAWRPAASRRCVVLVGKGVTFDSGGLSLKTTEGMLEMKSDMAGAAAVLSAILVAAEEKLPIEVHALAACTENMPSGTAYKLGDVLRSMAGKTVEINNTDAEGRLTLADALTYGLELQPDVILDFATLTGACVVALGPHTAGVMTNHESTARSWLDAATTAGEDMWQLPLPPRLIEQLKSEIADLRNTGERWGGALTAGLFLREFVGSTPWIHVDLAGPATAAKEWGCFNKGGTGFGVATIVEYLRTLAGSPLAASP